MIKIKRSDVRPGQTFYFNDNRHPCIALALDTGDKIKARNFGGDDQYLWHCYVLLGQISYNSKDAIVFVDA